MVEEMKIVSTGIGRKRERERKREKAEKNGVGG
jgi:hypothetical protein